MKKILALFLVLVMIALAGCKTEQTPAKLQSTPVPAEISTDTVQTENPETSTQESTDSADSTSSTDVIYIKNMAFNPETLKVAIGTTITWGQIDDVKHIVVSDELFESDVLNLGDKFTYTFTTPGTYEYYCKLHPAMTGTVIVE